MALDTAFTVLREANDLLQGVSENKKLARRLHANLSLLMHVLQENQERRVKIPEAVADAFGRVVHEYVTFLQEHQRKNVVQRICSYKSTCTKIQQFYQQVQLLSTTYTHAFTGEVSDFQQQMTQDLAALTAAVTQLAGDRERLMQELRSPSQQREALAELSAPPPSSSSPSSLRDDDVRSQAYKTILYADEISPQVLLEWASTANAEPTVMERLADMARALGHCFCLTSSSSAVADAASTQMKSKTTPHARRVDAMKALCELAKDPVSRIAIVEAGGIQRLATLLESTHVVVQQHATTALGLLALDVETHDAICRTNAVARLVALAQRQTPTLLLEALTTLERLVESTEKTHQQLTIIPLVIGKRGIPVDTNTTEMLDALTKARRNDDEECVSRALWTLHWKTRMGPTQRQEIATSPLMEQAISLMEDVEMTERVELAVGVVAALAKDKRGQQRIVQHDGIRVLVSLVDKGNEIQRHFAAIALDAISINDTTRRAIVVCNGIPPLVRLAAGGTTTQRQYAVAILGDLALKEAYARSIVASGAIPTLLAHCETGDDLQAQLAVRALAYIAFTSADAQEIVVQGGVSTLVRLLESGQRAATKLQRESTRVHRAKQSELRAHRRGRRQCAAAA
ncbi:hypothetical protein PINS_up019213 [Pythium insidiosum]|nr:hypothetical protein PINS_up019213 [Pythium insidiosum]